MGGGLESLQGVKSPGAVSCLGLWCWEPSGISNRKGRSQLSKPSGQKPRDKAGGGDGRPRRGG